MFKKLAFIEEQCQQLEKQVSDTKIMENRDTWRKLCKEYSNLLPIVEKYRQYKKNIETASEAKALLDDSSLESDFKIMLEEELTLAQSNIESISHELKLLLLPKNSEDEKNVIVEIRGGAGGEEAALFAHSLFRMYSMYAERKGWKVAVLSSNATGIGGIKEVAFSIEGSGAYSQLKFESGVHRVQRIPETEASGRIHTSTVTVAVLPEVEDVEIDINPDDLQIDTYRSGGAGGQHVNKTESAIRITHLPSGLVVICQDERSQHKNREIAMKMLRSKLYNAAQQAQADKIASDRKNQVGTGDRSERIRTYNYPQRRVTDHRIGLTLYKIDTIMDGDLDEIIEALALSEQSEKLKRSEFE